MASDWMKFRTPTHMEVLLTGMQFPVKICDENQSEKS